jgi:hypothetical protein
MKTISINVYEFNELPEKTRDKIRYELGADFGNNYSPRDEVMNKTLAPWIDKVLGLYRENSQGPYWGRTSSLYGIYELFTDFANKNKGTLKDNIKDIEGLSEVEKGFCKDLEIYTIGMKWDRYDGLYNDSGTFYARNTLRAIWSYYYNANTCVTSDEYLQEFCQANELFFDLNGRIING